MRASITRAYCCKDCVRGKAEQRRAVPSNAEETHRQSPRRTDASWLSPWATCLYSLRRPWDGPTGLTVTPTLAGDDDSRLDPGCPGLYHCEGAD